MDVIGFGGGEQARARGIRPGQQFVLAPEENWSDRAFDRIAADQIATFNMSADER
jgi:hypothetical protein